ncbi:MAG: hypothetical protein R6V55_00135, partial [Desulfovermiculus sp.]
PLPAMLIGPGRRGIDFRGKVVGQKKDAHGVFGYLRLSVVSYQLSVIGYRLAVIGYQLSVICKKPPV